MPTTPSESSPAQQPADLAEQLESLRSWVANVTGWQADIGVPRSLAVLSDTPHGDGDGDRQADRILLYPAQFRIPDRPFGPDAVAIDVRILVLAEAVDVVAATASLAELAVQAMARGDLALDVDPVLPNRSVLPLPVLAFGLTHHRTVPRRQSSPVRHLLTVAGDGLRRVTGRVVAQDGTPLAGATVRVLPSGAAITAGYDGRFTVTVPAGTTGLLRIHSHGQIIEHTVGGPTGGPARGPSRPGTELLDDIVVTGLGTDPSPSTDRPAAPAAEAET